MEKASSYYKFIKDVEKCYQKDNHVLIAVSEGIKTKDGKYIPEALGEMSTDSFGHAQLGGTAQILAQKIKEHFKRSFYEMHPLE